MRNGGILSTVVGTRFENRQTIVRKLVTAEKVMLVREPLNIHDPNAVAVQTINGEKFGYLNGALAFKLVSFLDEIAIPVIGKVVTFYVIKDTSNIGVIIHFILDKSSKLSYTEPGHYTHTDKYDPKLSGKRLNTYHEKDKYIQTYFYADVLGIGPAHWEFLTDFIRDNNALYLFNNSTCQDNQNCIHVESSDGKQIGFLDEELSDIIGLTIFEKHGKIPASIYSYGELIPTLHNNTIIIEFQIPEAISCDKTENRRIFINPTNDRIHIEDIDLSLRLIPSGNFYRNEFKYEKTTLVKEEYSFSIVQSVREKLTAEKVVIDKEFYLGEVPISAAQFKLFLDETKYITDATSKGWSCVNTICTNWGGDECYEEKHPKGWDFLYEFRNRDPSNLQELSAIHVSWNDAVAFCDWLSKKTNRKFRLPFEDEWEFSCRAGSDSKYYFGDNEGELYKYANFIRTNQWVAIGKLIPNPWGLYDMLGTINEWCMNNRIDVSTIKGDWPLDYDRSLGHVAIIKGGSWLDYACTASWRSEWNIDYSDDTLGFRVLMEA